MKRLLLPIIMVVLDGISFIASIFSLSIPMLFDALLATGLSVLVLTSHHSELKIKNKEKAIVAILLIRVIACPLLMTLFPLSRSNLVVSYIVLSIFVLVSLLCVIQCLLDSFSRETEENYKLPHLIVFLICFLFTFGYILGIGFSYYLNGEFTLYFTLPYILILISYVLSLVLNLLTKNKRLGIPVFLFFIFLCQGLTYLFLFLNNRNFIPLDFLIENPIGFCYPTGLISLWLAPFLLHKERKENQNISLKEIPSSQLSDQSKA